MAKKLPSGIRQLPSGKYACRPYDRNARKKGTQHQFDTLSEAVAYKERVESGRLRADRKQWTADEWVAEWTTNPDWQRPKETTNLHNAERVKKFGEDFKGVPLYLIDRGNARAWARENKTRVPAVRAMLNDARADMIIDANPFEGLRTPQGRGRKDIKPMTEAEIKKLSDTAYKMWEDWPVMGAMVITAAYSGLRLGELLALRWADINFEDGTISIERQWLQKPRKYGTTKNGQGRKVPLLPQVVAALRLLDRGSPAGDGLIFYSPRGKRIEHALHGYYWYQLRARFLGLITDQRAKDIDLEWHVLRHFTISWLVDQGVLPHDIAGVVGHTDGGRLVSELYGHLYEDNSINRIHQALAA